LSVREVILGRRLANRESGDRKIGAYEGIPAMGLDGFASSAYGPEAALAVLAALGAASTRYIGWVMLPILALLAILFASYYQTIRAYPTSGGAYVVAKENLGTTASLVAAAALMIDYVLNVAVGISAGVAALVSAIPQLHAYMLPLCLGILALVTLMNLRGTLDAGRLFAIPTYIFVVSFIFVLGLGLYRAALAGGNPEPVVAPPPLPDAIATVSLWLLLHAFANGCTAMTGVEAVSNGMSAFREPTVSHGHRTLAGIVIVLGMLLAGIAYLSKAYGIGAMNQTENTYRSVLSQLVSAVVGNGALYSIAIGSLLCVLVLSANTSFVGFPRLCRNIAEDGFLPRPFAISGHRLVYSIGILYLAITAGVLLIVFGGITEHLIPLFAIGAFLTFTLSQTGMVVHWLRQLKQARLPAQRRATLVHLLTNAAGAVTTAAALIIIVVAKFTHGAWITVAAVPAVIILLKAIRRYYDQVGARVRDSSPLQITSTAPPIVLVTIDEWNRLADKSLILALSLSPDVIGVHLAQLAGPQAHEEQRRLHEQWQRDVVEPARRAGHEPPKLVILQAQYRAIHEPVLRLTRELEAEFPGRVVAVLIPELVKQRWYQQLLHTHRARRLRSQLLKHGGTRLTIVNVPWYLHEPDATT
jgi:amino acid transporter